MPNHPFAARPNLTKRHTSPSPSALLALQTLEALPPTPKEANDPNHHLFSAQSRSPYQNHTQPIRKVSSSSFRLPQRPLSSQPQVEVEIKMPLIKTRSGSRSKRPASSSHSKSKASTGTAQTYPNFFPFDINFNLGSKGKHQRLASQHHSQPPPAISCYPSGQDADFGPANSHSNHQHHQFFSPFSSSTPPTFSKGSLNAMPSIQGVIDSYDANAQSDYLRLSLQSKKKKGKSKKERRDTLRLPMMDPRFQAEPATPSTAAQTDSPHDMMDTVEILGEMDHYNNQGDAYSQPVCLSASTQNADRFRPPAQDSVPVQNQGRRSRHVSLTIDTSLLTRPTMPSKESSAASSRSRSQSQSRSRSRPESQAVSIPSRNGSSIIEQDGSGMSAWYGQGQDGEEDLDDVELQALDVLELLNGHLMRDGYGYGTGSGASTTIATDQSTHKSSSAHHSHHQSNTARTSRTNSISHADSASSINRLSVKTGSTGLSSHSPSGRSDRHSPRYNVHTEGSVNPSHISNPPQPEHLQPSTHRKRTKSYGYGFSISHNPHSITSDMHHQHHTRGRGSVSIPSHRPPPPPPEGELPPLPTSISPLALGPPKHGPVPTRVAIDQDNTQGSSMFDQEAQTGSANANGVMRNVGHGKDGSGQESLLHERTENNRVMSTLLAKGRSSINAGAPPIPPRSASRASASGEGDKSLRRKLSRRMLPHSQLQQGDLNGNGTMTIVGRKNSKDKGEEVRVPLVLATTEQEDVVIIERRPQYPVTDLPSPLEPVYQRPLPPLPPPPAMQPVSPQRTPSIPHPKITARILRPKRPSTAPSRSEPMSPIDPSRATMKSPPMKLIPREEPRRLSASATPGSSPGSVPAFGLGSSSPMRSNKGRKEAMSALSFLALDEAAASQAPSLPQPSFRQARSVSYGTGVATFTYQPHAHAAHAGPAQTESSDGLEGGYIMPPKERSKIGVDVRAERRRRRRGSRSSVSSVAGSEGSRGPEHKQPDVDAGGGGVTVLDAEGVDGEWSTAWEYNNIKEKQREKELRLSLQLATRPQGAFADDIRAFPNPLSPPPRPKNRPAPLNALLLSRDDPEPASPRPMPKSAGLLPPPRPRRKTVPSGPTGAIVNSSTTSNTKTRAISRPTAISIVPVSPIDNDHPQAQGQGTYTQSPTFRQISPKYTHRANLDPTTPKAHDGMREFMELGSNSLSPSPCGSPKLETPGTFIFPPPEHLSRAIRREEPNVKEQTDGFSAQKQQQQQTRKLSALSPASDTPSVQAGAANENDLPGELGLVGEEVERSISISGSILTWSSESEREKERRMMTSLWLSAKPTKAKDYIDHRSGPTGEDHIGAPSGNGGPVYQRAPDRSHPFYGTVGRGRSAGVTVDGGYGRRGSLGIQV
ncbi:hypothetical protein IAT40_001096 [Kwoniella sp. CBS 6097]